MCSILIMVILAPSFMLSIVQLMFISVAAIISKYCFLADCSHYICQLYVNNDSQKYSLLDVLEMIYMYQLYLTIRCHIYNWTTADTEPRLKSVNLTTKTFAVYRENLPDNFLPDCIYLLKTKKRQKMNTYMNQPRWFI